jgi:prepilin-type N-terminal cleavage/methylation domain-containing protein
MRDSTRRGFSLIELLIVISVIAIMTAIAVPNIHKYLMSAHEHAAIEEIGTLHKAITQYYTQYRRYPQTLVELGPPAAGADGPEAANLIPRGLATGRKSGFVFTLTRTTTGYAINAVPETFGDTAARTFYSDQGMSVHYNLTAEPANANSPEL